MLQYNTRAKRIHQFDVQIKVILLNFGPFFYFSDKKSKNKIKNKFNFYLRYTSKK